MHGRWRMQQHGKPCRWRARASRKSARTGPGRQGGGEARSTGDAGQCRSREGASGAEGRGKDERLREWLCLLPRLEGRDFGTRHMRKRRGRTQTVRRCRGVDRPGGTPEATREAGRLACSGLGHRTSRFLPPTTRSGGPCARCMIPLESPVREIRTPGSESGGEETWLRERLRHRHMAKAAGKLLLPRPTAGRASPRLYPGRRRQAAKPRKRITKGPGPAPATARGRLRTPGIRPERAGSPSVRRQFGASAAAWESPGRLYRK